MSLLDEYDPALDGYTHPQDVSHGPFGPSGQHTPTYIEILERLRASAIAPATQDTPGSADDAEPQRLPIVEADVQLVPA